MAIRVPVTLQQRMVDHGLVPAGCLSVELHVPAHGSPVLRYDVLITRDHYALLAAAFLAAATGDPGE